MCVDRVWYGILMASSTLYDFNTNADWTESGRTAGNIECHDTLTSKRRLSSNTRFRSS